MNKLLENVMLQAVNSNPNAMKIIKEMNESGLSAKDFFYQKAKEMNIDPDTILVELNNGNFAKL